MTNFIKRMLKRIDPANHCVPHKTSPSLLENGQTIVHWSGHYKLRIYAASYADMLLVHGVTSLMGISHWEITTHAQYGLYYVEVTTKRVIAQSQVQRLIDKLGHIKLEVVRDPIG